MISIITPLFNDKAYIAYCLRNVIDQRCADMEHIVVDGGSTDGSLEILQRVARDHPHIRWISLPCNQSKAMNMGIAMARYPIIGMLNSDDYYEPRVLNRIVTLFADAPEPSLIIGNCNVWGDGGVLLAYNRPTKLRAAYLLSEEASFPCNPSAYFYHRSLHTDIGMYDESDEYMMDLDFLLRAVRVAHVQHIDETFGNYRKITGTKSVEFQKNPANITHHKNIMLRHMRALSRRQTFHVGMINLRSNISRICTKQLRKIAAHCRSR